MGQPKATWEKFDDEISDNLLRGMAAAFALVATADVDIAEDEIQRFVDLVKNEPSLRRVDVESIEPLFRSLASALLEDPESGRRRALEIVSATSARHADLVIAAAQMAIVADSHLLNVEELALREVCQALGVDPEGR
ncbi:MAG: TerB family tellurite resistance protein [Myxococcota bacterium]